MRWIQVILFLLLCSVNTWSQLSVSVSTDRDSVLVGDHILLNVTLQAANPADIASIDFSAWRNVDNLLYEVDTTMLEKQVGLSIIGENEWKISDQYLSTDAETMNAWWQNGSTITKPIKVSIYDYGAYSIPSPTIISKSGQKIPALESAIVVVMFPDLGMPADSISLMPIKDIIQEGTTWEDYKIWLYVLAFILFAPLLVYFLFGKKKEQVEAEPEPEIVIPAHVKALDALQVLDKKQLWQNGEIKTYQSGLTDIIRQYLEDRFEINALEMTTDEINQALRNKDFDTKHSATLQRILQIADLVKFAKATPPVDINAEFMREAVDFVQQTKKVITETHE